jgi:hypothetical protein
MVMPSCAPERKRTKRLEVIVSHEELAAINDFRFRARMPTLAAAVRELLRRGLGEKKKGQG